MAEFRNEWEQKLAKAFGKAAKPEYLALIRELGNPPRAENVPPDFWERMKKVLKEAIRPILVGAFLAAAAELAKSFAFAVSAESAAAAWARTYTDAILTDLVSSTEDFVAKSVGQFVSEDLTVEELEQLLATKFGAVRAAQIGRTHVTAAITAGDKAVVDELAAHGIHLEGVWNTVNDEKVCLICNPLNQTGPEVWRQRAPEGPPAHINCRCKLFYRSVT